MMTASANILIVEDDEVDIRGLKRAFQAAKIANPVFVARNGVEALEILRGNADQAPLARPYILLLDLNMPRMNGLEFLKTIRADSALKDTIVFVLTTSDADSDIVEAYRLNVAGYIVKRDPAHAFVESVKLLDHYWRIVELPV